MQAAPRLPVVPGALTAFDGGQAAALGAGAWGGPGCGALGFESGGEGAGGEGGNGCSAVNSP